MTKPDVSIIVAVYNAEDYIGRCLDSLIAQTYKNIEIICVNDASTDQSQQIIDSYKKKDERVRSIVHQQNMNAGGAMNDGIKAAKGEYVCIVDNDDWLSKNAIEVLLKASDNFKTDMVTCDWYAYKNAQHYTHRKNLTNSTIIADNINNSLLNGFRILGAIIRRSIFIDNTLFFPEKVFYEDNAIATAILCYAKSINPIHDVLYYYYLSPGSVTRSVSMKKIIDRIKTTDMFLFNLDKGGFVNESNKELVDYRYLCYTFSTLRMLTNNSESSVIDIINDIKGKVKDKLPNKYLSKLNPESARALSSPFLYYKKERFLVRLRKLVPDAAKRILRRIIGKELNKGTT